MTTLSLGLRYLRGSTIQNDVPTKPRSLTGSFFLSSLHILKTAHCWLTHPRGSLDPSAKAPDNTGWSASTPFALAGAPSTWSLRAFTAGGKAPALGKTAKGGAGVDVLIHSRQRCSVEAVPLKPRDPVGQPGHFHFKCVFPLYDCAGRRSEGGLVTKPSRQTESRV